MRRGEVWWANLPQPIGRRPVLLLSRNTAYQVRASVTVGAISSTIRGIPVEVPLDKSDGVPKECVVNLDNILTIPKSTLTKQITALSKEKMDLVNRAVVFALDLKV
ncbi:MAG: type II toxin-antitoxin system PemK/MazF family toxin [Actinobacteria bacterium]|nr:type II toxin-antitoxin system PemK/MazF family toxin [Actinomycetota bacterium]